MKRCLEHLLLHQLNETAYVTLTIYDAQGHIAQLLYLGQKDAGFYHNRSHAAYWDGRNKHNEKVASGLYFYQIYASSEARYGFQIPTPHRS